MGNIISYDEVSASLGLDVFNPATDSVRNQQGSVLRITYESSRYCIQGDDDHLVEHSPLIRLEFVHHRLGTTKFFGYAHDECIYTIDPITDKRKYIDPATIGALVNPFVVEDVEITVTTRQTFWSTWISETKDYEYRITTVLDANSCMRGSVVELKTYFINTALYPCGTF